MKPIHDLNETAAASALGGVKVPHGISNPVLRAMDGTVRVCYFVYTFDAAARRSGLVSRPCEWLALGIDEGELVGRFPCEEVDFTTEPFDGTYALVDGSAIKPTPEMYVRMDALIDEARASFIESAAVDMDAYAAYFQMLLDITPAAYRVFYRDLSMPV